MKSLAEELAEMTPAEEEVLLRDLGKADLDLRYDASFWLRPEQLDTLNSETWLTLLLAGRGYGKTRVLSEWVREKAKTPGTRIALVARTVADVRDTMVNGPSGILAVCPPEEQPDYVPSARTIRWPNGSVALTFSAEKADQLRGPQFDYAACDELASWRMLPDSSGLNAWDNLQIATRLGRNPQIMVATTPKRVPLLRQLVDRAKSDPGMIHLLRGATSDNLANLSSAYVELIYGMYSGTSIARQELFGELLAEVDGAMWSIANLDENRINGVPADVFSRKYMRVIGVDPSVAAKPGDECGIIIAAGTKGPQFKREAWVIDDVSMQGSPEAWTAQVVKSAKRWQAVVIAEQNQGGDLVRMAIQQNDPTVPVVLVHATKGKAQRAEPVVMAYEQGRVKHCGVHGLLEDEMTSWVPGESGYSPNRMDALVWGLSGLLGEGSSKIRSQTGEVRVSRSSGSARTITGLIPGYRAGRGVDRRWQGGGRL
jgi:phage terminase large subunit-like protein